jgi:drug/metabolite transporter (DMT)-like permease
MFLPLADATVITFIAPCLSCFACAMLLREPFTRLEQIGALVSFIGVTLIARPTTFFHLAPVAGTGADGTADAAPSNADHVGNSHASVTSSQRFAAVCVAVVGALGSAMAFTTMRWIGKRAHPILSVTYFCAFCTVVSAIAMMVIPGIDFLLPADTKEWSYLIFLGCCGFAMQFLLSAGLQLEKSSRATLMVYTQMLFALLFDKLVFGTNPNLLSLFGSALILGSAIYVAIQKESMKQKEDAKKARQAEADATGRVVEMESRGSAHLKDEEGGLLKAVDRSNERT